MNRFYRSLLDQMFPIEVCATSLTGEGGRVLQEACRESRVVIVGEDHGTAEIPAFVSALRTVWGADATPPTLAIETGCVTASFLNRFAISPKPLEAMQQALKAFGRFIPFYDSCEELQMLSEWAAAGSRIVGIDHEFLYAARMLSRALKDELADAPTPDDLRVFQDIEASQDSSLLRFDDRTLASMYDLAVLAGEGARHIALELILAYVVYATYFRVGKQSSAELRIKLFYRALRACPVGTLSPVMIKIGYNHGFRMANLEDIPDLGFHVQQLGVRLGFQSLHILVVGACGTRLKFSGPEEGSCPEGFSLTTDDPKLSALIPLLEMVDLGTGRVFDLRPVRKALVYPDDLSQEEHRIAYGYDLLVLLAGVTAAQLVL